MPLPPSFEARMVSARMLSPNVRELTFERVDGAAFGFEAGQWVNLVLPGDPSPYRRAYSIASAPDGSPRFELAVTRVADGPGSGLLHAMSPGSVVRAEGPQGFFTQGTNAGAPALFVATGTGVTPMRSMIRDALAHGATSPLWLLFGNRTEDDVLYDDEWRALEASHANVRAFRTLSRPGPSWTGRTGWVQSHVPELWTELAANGSVRPHVYVCGLVRMVNAVRELLKKDLGLPRQEIHTERYD
ncbi:MAG: FAD-dependent oxidoreductase [Polyangiaceae bacterium]